MKPLNHFDRIFAYAEGQMDEGQRTAFEAELSADVGLRAEYDAYLASQKAVELLALEELANRAVKDEKKEPPIIPIWRKRWVQVAAAAAVLIAAAILFWPGSRSLTPPQLATKYYVAPNLSPDRNLADQNNLERSKEAYISGSMTDAIRLAGSVPPDSSDYIEAQFVLGHAYFKSNQHARSAAAFANVTMGSDQGNAAFTRALALLLAGQTEAAKEALKVIIDKNNSSYVEEARKLWDDLDKM
ncbi:MAG: hypothetical protein AAFZ15_09385 [Bacteroidota bacterium]